MRFIENEDLREWVKDNLKKTIFQKAHSLAVQTGCEILVKMKDLTDTTSHQYYATGSLKRVYHANALKRVPGERSVSGETGLPSVDQSVQIGNETQGVYKEEVDDSVGEDGSAIPLQLTVENAETETSSETQGIRIKVEVDDESGASQSEQGLMSDATDQMSFSMECVDTSQMQYQTGYSMAGHGGNSQKYSVPITPKPYQCAMCHKAFRSVQVLQKHTQTFHMRPGHSGSGRGRGRGRGLNQFAKTLAYKQQTQQALISRQAELQSQSFTCVICNQTFERPELLSEHITNSHSDENSLAATLPGLPSQFDVDQTGTISDVDMSHSSQVLSFPHSAPSGLDLSSGGVTQQQQPYILQSPFKYQHGPGTSPSNRPSTSTGSPGSQSKRKWSFQRKEVTIRTIMSAILLSAGPISTHYAVRRYGPKYLRTPSIPKEQYVLAATALQEAKLGMLVTIKNATGLSDTFIKRSPNEIQEDLSKNSDLATIEEYTFRFHAPPPACITPAMQASIIQHGLLAPGSFSERKVRPQSAVAHNPSQIHDLRMLQIPTPFVSSISVPSGKKKEKQIHDSRIVTSIYSSSSQASVTSTSETLPIMVPFPDATFRSSVDGLDQDRTNSGQAVITSFADTLPTMVSDATYKPSAGDDLNQGPIPVSLGIDQAVKISSVDSLPSMVPDGSHKPGGEDLNQSLIPLSLAPGDQATLNSSPEPEPTMVPDELNENVNETSVRQTEISSVASEVCESESGDNDISVVPNA